jgi:hypothetical protein
VRKGDRRGVKRREWMKRDNGMKDRDERSRGIEIHMTDDFSKINPTEPFRLVKQVVRRNRI